MSEPDDGLKEYLKRQEETDKQRTTLKENLPPEYQKKFDAVEKATTLLHDAGVVHSLWTKLPDEDMKEGFWHWHNLAFKYDDQKDMHDDGLKMQDIFRANVTEVASKIGNYVAQSTGGGLTVEIHETMTGRVVYRTPGPYMFGYMCVPKKDLGMSED